MELDTARWITHYLTRDAPDGFSPPEAKTDSTRLDRALSRLQRQLLFLPEPNATEIVDLTMDGRLSMGGPPKWTVLLKLDEALILVGANYVPPAPESIDSAADSNLIAHLRPFKVSSPTITLELHFQSPGQNGLELETKWRFGEPLSFVLHGRISYFDYDSAEHDADRKEKFARSVATELGWTVSQPAAPQRR